MKHNFLIIPHNHVVEKAETAIIILPEIFGQNQFIQSVAGLLASKNYQPVFLEPLTYNFAYENKDEAHSYFLKTFGFSFADVFTGAIAGLKLNYKRVGLLGFSVGATLAWLCCKNADSGADFVIGCYGSRIRDFLHHQPCAPTLLLFAQNDSFVLEPVVAKLREKPLVTLEVYPASHGFMDSFGPSYHSKEAPKAFEKLLSFIDQQHNN